MANLYERFAGTEDGARRLAAARLRREALKALHRALKASGMSQVELAKRLGVRKSAVSQVLNGDGNVRITTLAEYLYATGHELTVAVVPSGQPRAEVLARRANVAVSQHAYATTEQASRQAVVYAALPLQTGGILEQVPEHSDDESRARAPRESLDPWARAWTRSPLPRSTDLSPLFLGVQRLESRSADAK